MNDEKKDAYEVGIPLEDLPSQESTDQESISAETSTEALLPKTESDASEDAAEDATGLPDLFAPEELAEVGLTAELALPEDSADDGPSGPSAEVSADDDIDVAAIDAYDENVAGSDEPNPDGMATDLSGLEPDPDNPPALSPQAEADLDAEVAVADVSSTAKDEALNEGDIADESDIRGEDDDFVAHPTDDAVIDQDLMVGRLESLGLQIEELKRDFEGKLKYDAHKDEIIDRLHSELQEYKQDIIKKYVLSIVMDVVKVADDIRKWLAYFRSLEVSQRDPRKLFRYVEAIPSDLEDVFYWHGVKPFSQQEGAFDPSRQRAIKKIPTDDPALDKCVAHSIRPGYEWETKVIRQEMVAVYVFKQGQESLDTGMIDE